MPGRSAWSKRPLDTPADRSLAERPAIISPLFAPDGHFLLPSSDAHGMRIF